MHAYTEDIWFVHDTSCFFSRNWLCCAAVHRRAFALLKSRLKSPLTEGSEIGNNGVEHVCCHGDLVQKKLVLPVSICAKRMCYVRKAMSKGANITHVHP